MIRQRKPTDPLQIVRKLDAFPKIPTEYKKTSTIGGTFSILSRIIIIYLIYKEILYYMDSKLIFKFKPDTDMDTKLKIHIDMTIASQCRNIGADILDTTQQNIFAFGILEEEDTWWLLENKQREYFDYVQHINGYLRESYHSLFEILYKSDHKVTYNFPKRKYNGHNRFDACRLHGSLTLNKVAGNFHVTGGKSLHFPRGHIHISGLFDDSNQNFSHRINRFSFGDEIAGIIHPLEGDEKILTDSTTMMQYFIEVVPTDVHTLLSSIKTFQYSVKENSRPINHDKGSHGVPGLYFKYDVSALKIIVKQDRENIIKFIVRLSATIAGIIVISGFFNSIIQYLYTELYIPMMIPKQYQKLDTLQEQLQKQQQNLNVTNSVNKKEDNISAMSIPKPTGNVLTQVPDVIPNITLFK